MMGVIFLLNVGTVQAGLRARAIFRRAMSVPLTTGVPTIAGQVEGLKKRHLALAGESCFLAGGQIGWHKATQQTCPTLYRVAFGARMLRAKTARRHQDRQENKGVGNDGAGGAK